MGCGASAQQPIEFKASIVSGDQPRRRKSLSSIGTGAVSIRAAFEGQLRQLLRPLFLNASQHATTTATPTTLQSSSYFRPATMTIKPGVISPVNNTSSLSPMKSKSQSSSAASSPRGNLKKSLSPLKPQLSPSTSLLNISLNPSDGSIGGVVRIVDLIVAYFDVRQTMKDVDLNEQGLGQLAALLPEYLTEQTKDEEIRIKQHARKKQLLDASWEKVHALGFDTVADLLYKRVFEIAPAAAAFFKDTDMKRQGQKLLSMFDHALKQWDHPFFEHMLKTGRLLGHSHKMLGIQVAHYAPVLDALLWTLQTGLGPLFDKETRAAWIWWYNVIADVMCSGATIGPEKANLMYGGGGETTSTKTKQGVVEVKGANEGLSSSSSASSSQIRPTVLNSYSLNPVSAPNNRSQSLTPDNTNTSSSSSSSSSSNSNSLNPVSVPNNRSRSLATDNITGNSNNNHNNSQLLRSLQNSSSNNNNNNNNNNSNRDIVVTNLE